MMMFTTQLHGES